MKIKTMCLALECENIIIRDAFRFGTGFCKKCQKEYDKNVINQIIAERYEI